MSLLRRAAAWFDRRRAPVVMFVGNEYDLLADKIGFIDSVGVEFVCSQLPLAAARYLYGDCVGAQIIALPHALNPQHYRPLPGVVRDIDIGFVGDIYWPFIGDRERSDVIEWFERNGSRHGLCCDIRRTRLPRDQWNLFLNRCKALIGAESGTYYLNERGALLARARHYNLTEHREAGFTEVFDRFFRGQPRTVSGKCISSRHFEPIGTKTCQILLAGEYNGILEGDRHYIAIAADFGNIAEVIERFRDCSYRRRMVEDTYDYVMAEHTYRHRIAYLLERVGGGRPPAAATAAAD
jgi:hypothetical protein